MELKTVEIIVYILTPILTAVLGGWVGAYFGNRYRENKESHEKEEVRNIAIKASTQYKEEIGLRINDNFPFQNLFLVVEQDIRPLHQHRIDTLNCKLIDKYGTIKGRGLSYYQYNFHLTTLQLNAGDTLDVHIRHHMKREILPGIANIGIKLSKQ